MYRTRGKPVDKAKKVVTQQEKDLASAIHINQIKKGGIVPKLRLGEDRVGDLVCFKNQRVQASRKVVASSKKLVNTHEVAIPHQPKWESSKIEGSSADDGFLKQQLDEASLELSVGSVQLEEIKKLLDSTGGGRANAERCLYNVERKPRKDLQLEKKNRFLLTLNNVHQRMQKMQCKFFNGTGGVRYKSVRDCCKKIEDGGDQNVEVCVSNEREIMTSARRALARRSCLLDNEDGAAKSVDYQSRLQSSIEKSNYLKKEFEAQTKNDGGVNTDDSFFGKLEQSFSTRPFGKAQPAKAYWPVFNSLKDTLYEAE